jgi:hypothetical protein
MTGITTLRRCEMSTQMKKLFLLIVAIGVLFTATTITAPADAAAPPSERISISFDRKTCTVTATFKWKNYDSATFDHAHMALSGGGTSSNVQSTSVQASGTIFATLDVPRTGFGYQYSALGAVYFVGGGVSDVSQTRTLTAVCGG